MTELAFTKKPRRMTSPPQNQQEWIVGYDGVEVRMETDPVRIAYFAREATWGDLMREPNNDEINDTLAEVAGGKVLGAAYKGGIGFRIRASRSCMDQMLRLAEGSGGAGSGAGAQTTRDNDHRDFNIIIPNTIESLKENRDISGWPDPISLVRSLMEGSSLSKGDLHDVTEWGIEFQRKLYGALVDAGVPPQDARYPALPLGFQTQWFHIMSLGNLIKLCEQRLCNGLTQHETNYLVRVIRDIVIREWPWMDGQLQSMCEKRGQCAGSTMLFPACGAFINNAVAKKRFTASLEENIDFWSEEQVAREVRENIIRYDPAKHLYPTEQNDAMQFARWDIERQEREKDRPDAIFSMAGPPEFLCYKQYDYS